jgi:DNA-binding GntR family transcriptional regulator
MVADYVRRAIVTGALTPGEKLNVAAFADRLGVSHTPAREAFQLLASEGLLELSPYRGARVAPLSADEYQEIFLMRVGLEGLAARLGAIRIDEEGTAQMSARLDEMAAASKAGDVDAFLTADRAFHEIHYRASGRDRLWSRVINLRLAAERYTRAAYKLPKGGLADTVRSHRELLKAVKKHDGARSEAIITEDLERTYDSLAAELEREAAAR